MLLFNNDLDILGIELNNKQRAQFDDYYKLLSQWNSVSNLTAIVEYEDVYKKHFVDSLAIVNAGSNILYSIEKVIDVGTGAGFPGIPLKIAFPDLDMTLLDSQSKRVKFLDHVIKSLDLKGIVALHGRAEDFAKQEMREKFNLCVSRAVANLSTLSEYCLPFVKIGGFFISYKSEKIAEEITDSQSAITILGGNIQDKITYSLPDSDINRSLILIKKINNTPDIFPRKAGIPTKKPL